jgi:hypothetical protein
MNLIGQTIKTHDNKFVGKVLSQEVVPVAEIHRWLQGIDPSEAYVSYAVELENAKPSNWTHVIARSDEDAFDKYVVA